MHWIRNNIGLALSAVVAIIVVILILLPINVPFNIKEPGKILPAKEWLLQKNFSGGITTTLYDHKNGSIEMNSMNSKAGNMKFFSNPRLADPEHSGVKQGDTIGFVRQSVVEPSKVEAEETKPILSPISGLLSGQLNDSVFLSVRDISEFLVAVPVKPRDMKYVNTGQTMLVKIPGTKDVYEAKVLKTENDFQMIKGNQYMIITGILNVMTKEIQAGMIARCTIECPPVRMKEFINRTLELGVNEE